MEFHKEVIDGVTYTLHAIQDDQPVGSYWGPELQNTIADCKRRLKRGDVWAWADVEVRAEMTVNGVLFSGEDWIGGCSYENAEDFLKNGYWEDMKKTAYEALLVNLEPKGIEVKSGSPQGTQRSAEAILRDLVKAVAEIEDYRGEQEKADDTYGVAGNISRKLMLEAGELTGVRVEEVVR